MDQEKISKIKALELRLACTINDEVNRFSDELNLVDNKIQELNKIIYSIYDNHIKVIENYTKYCATSIARKHKSNKNKTNTKQQ